MGGEYRLERRAEQQLPAPMPAVEFDAPDQVEAAIPIPGLAIAADPVRRSSGDQLGGSTVDATTEHALKSPTGGTRLDDPVRTSMESAFQTDFSDVRVHTGSGAAKLSQDMQAAAFTHGSNIYFSQGSYDPGSERGQHLLAHELTHVVQRKQGRDTGRPSPSGAPTIGKADDPLETEAEQVAGQVVGALRRRAGSGEAP